MAKRRMFSLDVVDTDHFLDMPTSTQNLYFHLCMRADDDWFISSPRRIMLLANATQNDLDLLRMKSYIIPFEKWICVIRHRKVNNYLRGDRYTKTQYQEEFSQLSLENDVYSSNTSSHLVGIPVVDTGKDRSGKDSIDKDSIGHILSNDNTTIVDEEKRTNKKKSVEFVNKEQYIEKIWIVIDRYENEWYDRKDLLWSSEMCWEHNQTKWWIKVPTTAFDNRIKKQIERWKLSKPKKKMEYATLDD